MNKYISKITFRKDSDANLKATNPILDLGEPCINVDTLEFKIGDGVTPWNSLQSQSGGIDDFVARLVNVEEISAANQTSIGVLDGAIESLSTTVSGHTTNIESLGSQITSLSSSVSGKQGAIEDSTDIVKIENEPNKLFLNSTLSGKINKAILLPAEAPLASNIPSIDASGAQENLTLGDGLQISSGVLDSKLKSTSYTLTLTSNDIEDSTASMIAFNSVSKDSFSTILTGITTLDSNSKLIKAECRLTDANSSNSFDILLDYHPATTISVQGFSGVLPVSVAEGTIGTMSLSISENNLVLQFNSALSSLGTVIGTTGAKLVVNILHKA